MCIEYVDEYLSKCWHCVDRSPFAHVDMSLLLVNNPWFFKRTRISQKKNTN